MLRQPPYVREQYQAMPREPLHIISRNDWGAVPPTKEEDFSTYPTENIIMGYTDTERCVTTEECIKTMQELQKKHMEEGMSDIRYSYVVGGDGKVYEGRGWKKKAGVHYRFPELQGENVEIAITDKKGKLPDAYSSHVMWHLQDQAIWDGILPKMMEYFQDFEDPLPPVTELTGEDIIPGVDPGYDWSQHDAEYGYA